MGIAQSQPKHSDHDDDDDDDDKDQSCSRHCFFVDIGKITSKKSSLDPMGSPQPDTPLIERRKRKEAAKIVSSQRTGSNSRYGGGGGGIDKEVKEAIAEMDSATANKTKASASGSNQSSKKDDGSDIIHDGPDCEKELHQKYQLMEVLGVGSTSTVHRCLNKNNDLHYACKIIDKLQMEDRFAGMMTQFQTEIEALRRLQHPCIIRLYDVYLTGDKIYIIMEMMEGGELFDYVVQKGTLNEEEASQIVRRVTSALLYMHSKNIVHRDLKPENLLLKRKPKPTEDVEVKIIDFGLSKAMEEPVARSFLGTRGYLAPEMLQRREYTKAVDTWALGVIVFVLLCGCLPFDDDSQTVPSDDIVKAKFVLRFPRWASNLSASAKDLLSHLLDTNPQTRYSAEQALNHPWVKGQTAPRKNLLSSPGRIKKSPLLRTPRSVQQQKRRPPNGRRQKNPYASPDGSQCSETPPQTQVKRKQSI